MNGEPIVVIKPGEAVLIGEESSPIKAEVSGVLFRPGLNVQYQCVWWDNRTRKEEWIEAKEVLPMSPDDAFMKIGFGRV